MMQIGQIKDWKPKKLEEGIGGGCLLIVHVDRVRDNPPVGVGQPAVGNGAVNDAVVALAGLQQHAAREQERGGRGIDHRVPHGVHALRSVHVVEARGVHVEPHVAVRGVDEHVVGPAGKLQMAVGFEFRGGAVVGQRIAGPVLVLCLPLHGSSGFRRRFRHGQWHHLLAGVVGQVRGGRQTGGRAGALGDVRLALRHRCRIGQHLRGLRAQIQVAGGQKRDTY